jgi:hypothetical protein
MAEYDMGIEAAIKVLNKKEITPENCGKIEAAVSALGMLDHLGDMAESTEEKKFMGNLLTSKAFEENKIRLGKAQSECRKKYPI